tara:strand:+ start:132 stop:344 length:213 start_codon:yes stop_codon:yes gene_type:complete
MLKTKEKNYSNAHKTKKIDREGNVAFLKYINKDTLLQFKDLMMGSTDAEINKKMKTLIEGTEKQKKKKKK